MATIEKLGAAFIQKLFRRPSLDLKIPMKEVAGKTEKPVRVRHDANANAEPIDTKQQRPESSPVRSRASENVIEQKRMSLEELAELLRKINLTFDLFEVQAKFSTDPVTGQIKVEVVNQRTGEVIRKIPPYEVPRVYDALRNGEPLMTDTEA